MRVVACIESSHATQGNSPGTNQGQVNPMADICCEKDIWFLLQDCVLGENSYLNLISASALFGSHATQDNCPESNQGQVNPIADIRCERTSG
ncbi:hypothetical protein CEXT_93801 [Caerostris extrusa]|uniref:Uncharacterized protein n=1 Tax=Caerostris extrusa TaxID=172846 RepID=A0AAV4WA75_CAEEX|nr:hypothetical protein CEXT_93801 [Caerostris extrusa]